MDPATIAASVVSILAPYAIKGAKAFGEAVGEIGLSQARKLIDTLKRHFSGDEEAGPVIQNFEKKPERYQNVLQDVLEERVGKDPALASELHSQLETMGPVLEITQNMKVARDVTAAKVGVMTNGTLRAKQNIDDAQNVKGIDIEKLGR